MALQGDPRAWSADTKQGTVWTALADVPSYGHVAGAAKIDGRKAPKCPTCRSAYLTLLPTLGEEPLVFRDRTGMPLPRGGERADRLRNFIAEVHAYAAGFVPGAEPVPTPEPTPEPEAAPEPDTRASRADVERYLREVERLRRFCDERGHDTLNSMRVTQDGIDAILAGAPVDGLLASIGATWQDDTRAQGQIPSFDATTFGTRNPGRHASSDYVAALVQAGIPVWLHGPAGTGKSSAAKHAADVAKLDYYEVNLAGAMASAVKGKDRLKEFVQTAFIRAYRDGGLICLEEFDAAHPTVATAINNAIAGDEFHNDTNDEVVARHPNFRVVATANTLGTGATKEFASRNRLDGATLDRFRMGRVYVGLDRELERAIIDAKLAA